MGPRRRGLLCYRKGLCWERRGRAHRQRPPPASSPPHTPAALGSGVWAATAAPHRTAPHRACMHASSSPGLCSPCNPLARSLSRSLALPWGSERDRFAANLPILRTAAAPALAPVPAPVPRRMQRAGVWTAGSDLPRRPLRP
jgi:hypothetical protein